MKKYLALLLAIAIMVFMFTGCAGSTSSTESADSTSSETPASSEVTSSEPAKPVQLSVAWWGNQKRNDLTQQAFDLYTAEYPNVTFDGQPAEWTDYWNKLATAAAAHSLPDFIQMDASQLNGFVESGLLLDINPYVKSGSLDLSNVKQSIIDPGTVGDGLYAIAGGISSVAMVYNKTLLDANEIKVKDYMTTKEFIDLSKEIYAKTGYKADLRTAYNNVFPYMARGAGIFNPFTAGKLDVTSPDQLSSLFNMSETGYKDGWAVDIKVFAERTYGAIEQLPLVYGSGPKDMSWCAFLGSSQLTAAQAAAPKDMELAVTTIPADDPQKALSLVGNLYFSISVDSKNPKESAEFINYLTNSVECNNILLGERGIPISSIVAKAISAKMDSVAQKHVTFITEVVTPNCTLASPIPANGYAEVTNLVGQLQEQIFYGKITADAASQQLFTDGNKIMADAAKSE